MQEIINGHDLNLYYLINGYNYPACHATDCKLSLVADIQETTTLSSLKGKTFDYTGKYSYTLSLMGALTLSDVPNISLFQDAILGSLKMFFIFTDSNQIEWSGTVLITQVDNDSPVASISTFTNTMQGDGELTKITSGVTPPPAGSSVTITDQLGNVLAVIPAPGTYGVLRFDRINLGNASSAPADLIIMQGS